MFVSPRYSHWWLILDNTSLMSLNNRIYSVWKGQIKLILWCLNQAAVTMQTDGCLFSPQEGSTESIYEPAYSQTLREVQPKYQCSPVLLRRKLEWGGSDPSVFFVSVISLCFSQTLTWSTNQTIFKLLNTFELEIQTCDTQIIHWLHKDRMKAWESCNRGVDQACALLQFNSFRLEFT